MALVPPGEVTVTSTTPLPGGEVAVTTHTPLVDVEATANLTAAADPKSTPLTWHRLSPVILIVVPPAAGPNAGEIEAITGA